jgi:dimethylaniline monooxygenase (N-oxide forming)
MAAAALRRAGVDFELLEARDGVGGTWRYDPDGEGSACYASLVTNTSKLKTSLAGRRIPGRPWGYAAHAEMLAYLEAVADGEHLRPHLRCGWRVERARREGEGWALTSAAGEERGYSAVVCALGVNGRPRFADIPGAFSGEQLHSASYRTADRFAGRDVLVVGLGTSGSEVAGDVAGIARSVHVAVRSPLWMMTRRLAGVPLDWLDNPWVARVTPWSLRRPVFRALCTATTGRLHRRGVPRPTRRCGDDVIAISDSFPRAVRRGLVDFHPAVSGVEGRRVAFADGSSVEVDAIVHATGFEPATDFLPEDARPAADGLYRGVVHPNVGGLYFVGLVEAHRALLPIAEQQAAWTADALTGRVAIPTPEERRRVAVEASRRRARDFGDRHPFMVDYARYLATLRRDCRAARA